MNTTKAAPKTLLTTAMALALCGLAAPAHALQLTATVDYVVGAGARDGSPEDSATAPPGSVADILNGSTVSPNSVFYHVGGNSAGDYASRVSGEGTFDISGQWVSEFQFSSPTGGAATYTLGITSGELSIGELTSTHASETALAEYTLIVSLNGTEQSRSQASLSMNSSGAISFTDAGSDFTLASYTSGSSSFSWASQDVAIALGTFAPGEIFTVGVDLVTTASATFTTSSTCTGGGRDGIGNEPSATDGIGGNCGAVARIGDPPGLTFDPNNPGVGGGGSGTIGGGFSQVPEPGSLALLLAGGLAALRGARRR